MPKPTRERQLKDLNEAVGLLPAASDPTTKWSPRERDAAAALGSPSTGLSSEKSRAQLEAYVLSLEIEEALGALPPADMDIDGGRRRRRMRGGGPIANKAFAWLWGKISGTVKPMGDAETAKALGDVLTAASAQPAAAVAAVDRSAAAAIRSAIPVVQGVSAAAPAALVALGTNYLRAHPSLVVAVADYASKMAVKVGDNFGLLGPSWGTAISEFKDVANITVRAAKEGALIVADRPYVAAYIAYLLLAQYAKYKGTSITELLKTTGNAVAGAALGSATGVASAASGLASDVASVSAAQYAEFEQWLNQRPDVDASLKELGAKVKTELKAKADAAKAKAKEEEQKAVDMGAVAPQASGPGDDANPIQAGRRSTSRRYRRASGPRRTRRSSSGRRQGYSRRRRE